MAKFNELYPVHSAATPEYSLYIRIIFKHLLIIVIITITNLTTSTYTHWFLYWYQLDTQFFYINYIKLSSSTCFERHPLIFRRSMMLIVHVCSLWYSYSLKVNYCFIVLGICYHFVKKEKTMCRCIALCWPISAS